jgi:hypothetical protein
MPLLLLLLLLLQGDVMFSRMRSTAYDMAGSGYDARTGYGFIAGNRLLVVSGGGSSSSNHLSNNCM